MAVIAVYYQQKIAGTGWRYRPLTVGRGPEAAKNGPFFIRVRNGYAYIFKKRLLRSPRAAIAELAQPSMNSGGTGCCCPVHTELHSTTLIAWAVRQMRSSSCSHVLTWTSALRVTGG